jgi:hypothetical protein
MSSEAKVHYIHHWEAFGKKHSSVGCGRDQRRGYKGQYMIANLRTTEDLDAVTCEACLHSYDYQSVLRQQSEAAKPKAYVRQLPAPASDLYRTAICPWCGRRCAVEQDTASFKLMVNAIPALPLGPERDAAWAALDNWAKDFCWTKQRRDPSGTCISTIMAGGAKIENRLIEILEERDRLIEAVRSTYEYSSDEELEQFIAEVRAGTRPRNPFNGALE